MRRIFDVGEHEEFLSVVHPFRVLAIDVMDAINDACEHENCHVTVEDGYRDMAGQLKEWSKGRTLIGSEWEVTNKKRIVTRAPPGHSPHQYRLAIHAVLRYDEPNAKDGLHHWLVDSDKRWYSIVGDIVTSYGLIWGGNFKGLFDAAHIEAPYWREVADQYGWQGLPEDAIISQP